jgi:DNA-binding FadR family transcriptional regulator
MQSTACNAVHKAEERLARWLLTAQDHVGTHKFSLTQEFAAMMLGVTRPTVSDVAATLQRAGLIAYRRGFVTIVDRERLEAAACECYAITAAIVDSLNARQVQIREITRIQPVRRQPRPLAEEDIHRLSAASRGN